MADGDVQQPDCDLWDAVRRLLPESAGWPPDSETLAEQLSARWTKAKDTFNDSLLLVDYTASQIHPSGGGGTWPDSAGGFMQRLITQKNGPEGFRQIAGALGGMAAEYHFYSAILKSAKTSIKDYVEDLSWQYTAMGFNIPRLARLNQAHFAMNVATEVVKMLEQHAGWLKDPETLPKEEEPSNNLLSGLWDSIKDQGKALAGLFGRGEDGSWSVFNAQVAWGHMDKLLAALAVYSLPNGLGPVVDKQVFDGVLGDYLAKAGKAFVDYENWDNAPLHAIGYTTGMVAGLIGPTRGLGAAVKLAGKGLGVPRVVKFGEGIQKATLTNGLFKAVGKLDDTLKARRIAKGDEFVLHPSVTPEVARLIHDRPVETPATGPRGPGAEPHGPGPAKPSSPQAPHPEARPEPRAPHDGDPPSGTPVREQHSTPPGGHGERVPAETPRASHAEQPPMSKGDVPEKLGHEPRTSSAEPPSARHEPSSGSPETRPPHPREETPGRPPSTAADHAPATRPEGQHSGSGRPSGHGAEAAHPRSADTPSSAPGREAPAVTPPMHTSAGDSPAKRSEPGGPGRGTPAKPSPEELQRLRDDAAVARMERKLYEEALRESGGVVYSDRAVKAWSQHAASFGAAGHGKPGDAAARAPGRLKLEEFVRTHFPDEYRKAHEEAGKGPHDEGPPSEGGGSPDCPPPNPHPSGSGGSGGAAHAAAGRGSVALDTRPPVIEKAPQPESAPAAAKARVETPAPEPQTAQPIPNKPIILHPDGTPEPLRPMTVTPVREAEAVPDQVTGPGKPGEPGSPSRMNPGWAEPPRVGWPDTPRVGWAEPPRVGGTEPPPVGWPRPPAVGWPDRPVPGSLAPAAPEHPADPDLPGFPKTPVPSPEVPPVPVTPEIPELPREPEIPELPREPEVPVTIEGTVFPELPKGPEIPELPQDPEIPEPLKDPEVPADPFQAAQGKPAPEFRPWERWSDPGRRVPWPEPEGVQEYVESVIARNAARELLANLRAGAAQQDPSGPVTLGGPPRPDPDVPATQPESSGRPDTPASSPLPPPGIPFAVWRGLSRAERSALADIHSRGLNAAGTLAGTIAQVRNGKKPPPVRKIPKLLGKMAEAQRAELEARLTGYTEGTTPAPPARYLDRTGGLGGPATLTPADHESLDRVAALDREISRSWANPWRRRRLRDELSGLLDELGLNPNQPDFAHRAVALANHPVAPAVWRRLGPLDDQYGLPTTRQNLATQLSGTIIPGTIPSAVFIAMGSVHAGIAYGLATILAAVTAGLLTRRHEIGDDAALAAVRKDLDAQRQYEQVFLPTDRERLLAERLGQPEGHGPDLGAVESPKGTDAAGTQKLRHFYLRYGAPPATAVAVGMSPLLELGASGQWGLVIGGGVAAIAAPLLQWRRALAKVRTELKAGERNARLLMADAAPAEDKADRARARALSDRPVPDPDAPGPGAPPREPDLPMRATATEGVEGLVQIGRRTLRPSSPQPLDPNAVFKVSLYEAVFAYGIAKGLLVLPAIPLVSRVDKVEMINKVARTAVDKRAQFDAQQAKDLELQAAQLAAVGAARTAAADAVARRPGLLRRLFGRPGEPPAAPAPVPAQRTGPMPSPIPRERPGSVSKSDYKNVQRALAVVGGFGSAAAALALGMDLAYAVAALTAAATGGWVGRDKWRHRQVELTARNKKADADAVKAFAEYEHDAAALADFLTERMTQPFLSIAAEAERAGRSDVLGLLSNVWAVLTRNVEAGAAPAPRATPFDELGPMRIEGDRWHDRAVRDRALAELDEIRRSALAEQAELAARSGDWSTLAKRLGLLATVLDLASRAVTHLGHLGQHGAGPVQTAIAGLNDAVHDYQEAGPRYLEPPAEIRAARESLSKVDDAAALYLDRSAPSWRRPRASDVRAALGAVDEAVRGFRRESVPGDRATGDEAAVHKAIDRYEELRAPNRQEPPPAVTRAAVTELRNAIARHRDETAAGWRRPDPATDEVREALTGLKHAITRHHQINATRRTGPRAESITVALNEIERIIDRYRRESAPKWREPAGQDAKLGQILGALHWALHRYWQVSAPRGRAFTAYDKTMKAAEKDLKKALFAVKKLEVAGMTGNPAEAPPRDPGQTPGSGHEVRYAPAGMSVGPAAETHQAHLRTMIATRPDPSQPYVVTVHDDGALPSPEELADATRHSEYYTPGRPVRLQSCRSATWARRFAVALGAPVVAPVADLHVLGRRTELPDGTVLPFGQGVVEGYGVGDGWAEFPPNGKRPVMLHSTTGSRPITLDELNRANPVALGNPDGFSKLFRTSPLNELSALHAGTARLRPAEVKAYLEKFHPQLGKVNPGFHGEDAVAAGYTTNCTRAVVYHERRRRGEDVTAPPLRPEDAALGTLGYVADRLGGEWEHGHGTDYDSVISAMLDRPVGSMAVLAVDSKTRTGTENKHVAVVSRDRHGIVFLDPLDGSLMELPPRPTRIALLPYTDADAAPGNLRLPETTGIRRTDEKIVTVSPEGNATFRSLSEVASDHGYNGHPAYDRYPPAPGSGPVDGSPLFRATPLHSLPAMDADTVDGRWKDAVAFVLEHFPQLRETNPGYYADWAAQLGFHTNCTRSVVHYVRRLLGEDVTAPPVPVELKDEIARLGYVSEHLGGTWTEIDDVRYDSVISAMLARPAGALAAVNFYYEKDNGTEDSHVALVARHPDGVVFLDPLTGWLTLLPERPLRIHLLPFPGKRGV
ncbi:hypothetical protein GCM10027598_48480 [Amycolatopsis oliviviridis]|uniref:Uncharacterized protein n=1 Tax=Amycolatopsis oliviviridis TaxID=1471590 RepID=A0ABQ3M167_9PSEU|nr:toxin glutamine deamidase domain-containing protein [Amycolatopsis oliviviridis]GHH30847.1 hypothetical protein GCM10017790_64970 [Amycolatopsis oliviviridis]